MASNMSVTYIVLINDESESCKQITSIHLSDYVMSMKYHAYYCQLKENQLIHSQQNSINGMHTQKCTDSWKLNYNKSANLMDLLICINLKKVIFIVKYV